MLTEIRPAQSGPVQVRSAGGAKCSKAGTMTEAKPLHAGNMLSTTNSFRRKTFSPAC